MKRERQGGRTEGKVRQKEEVRGGSVIDGLIKKKNPEKEINLEGTGEAQLSCHSLLIHFVLFDTHPSIRPYYKQGMHKQKPKD